MNCNLFLIIWLINLGSCGAPDADTGGSQHRLEEGEPGLRKGSDKSDKSGLAGNLAQGIDSRAEGEGVKISIMIEDTILLETVEVRIFSQNLLELEHNYEKRFKDCYGMVNDQGESWTVCPEGVYEPLNIEPEIVVLSPSDVRQGKWEFHSKSLKHGEEYRIHASAESSDNCNSASVGKSGVLRDSLIDLSSRYWVHTMMGCTWEESEAFTTAH